MSAQKITNRRRRERFALQPGYCGVAVRRLDLGEVMHGHAYDISETGARIELDDRLTAGESIQLWIDLGHARVTARATVIWQFDADADDPGPVRMALDYTDGMSEDDLRRLVRYISTTGLLRSA